MGDLFGASHARHRERPGLGREADHEGAGFLVEQILGGLLAGDEAVEPVFFQHVAQPRQEETRGERTLVAEF